MPAFERVQFRTAVLEPIAAPDLCANCSAASPDCVNEERPGDACMGQASLLPGPGAHAPVACRVAPHNARLLVFLVFALGWAGAVHVAIPCAAAAESDAPAIGDSINVGAPPQDNVFDSQAAELRRALMEFRVLHEGPPVDASPFHLSRNTLLLEAVFLLSVALAWPRIARQINKRFNPWALPAARLADYLAETRAGDEAFSDFAEALRIGPLAVSRNSDLTATRTPIEAFLNAAPKRLLSMRKALQELCRFSEEAARKSMLIELGAELRGLKGMAGLPELLPVWQMAYALECLVKQLSEKPGRITASTLRIVAGAVDLLEELTRPGLRPDLCTNPPIRVLAVDDDAISRHAVAFALKKGVGRPDVAENGPAALELAAKQHYDVLFLDVQMPGMDGFELCSKIHETECNRATPAVFVTMHSDFGSRAKSTLCGGNDLIGKPFLIFEITVKALTLALRSRLHSGDSKAEVPEGTAGAEAAPQSPAKGDVAALGLAPAAAPASTTPSAHPRPTGSPTRAATERELAQAAGKSADAFFAGAPAQLEKARELVQQATATARETERQEAFANLYLVVHSLSPEEGWEQLRPVYRVTLALKGLLKKLLEAPANLTESVLPTLVSALDLLQALCVKGVEANLATTPPVQMLVVDDDPISRRAISGALQIAFGRPYSAEDGEGALALAEKKAFDVVFMDVQMPGMDGFSACLKIHETTANRDTPVVFVTSNGDSKARHQSALCGGSDFITKPFLSQEMTLKALTFALRRRLQPHSAGEPALAQEQRVLLA